MPPKAPAAKRTESGSQKKVSWRVKVEQDAAFWSLVRRLWISGVLLCAVVGFWVWVLQVASTFHIAGPATALPPTTTILPPTLPPHTIDADAAQAAAVVRAVNAANADRKSKGLPSISSTDELSQALADGGIPNRPGNPEGLGDDSAATPSELPNPGAGRSEGRAAAAAAAGGAGDPLRKQRSGDGNDGGDGGGVGDRTAGAAREPTRPAQLYEGGEAALKRNALENELAILTQETKAFKHSIAVLSIVLNQTAAELSHLWDEADHYKKGLAAAKTATTAILTATTVKADSSLYRESEKAFGLIPFQHVTKVTGSLNMTESSSQTGFGLPKLDHVQGGIWVQRNRHLTQMPNNDKIAIIGASLEIFNNPVLLGLDGLSNLVTLGGGISIHDNSVLESCGGFRRLRAIGLFDLVIYGNPALTSITGFSTLETIGGALEISRNSKLQSLAGFSALRRVNATISFANNGPDFDYSGLAGLECHGGVFGDQPATYCPDCPDWLLGLPRCSAGRAAYTGPVPADPPRPAPMPTPSPGTGVIEDCINDDSTRGAHTAGAHSCTSWYDETPEDCGKFDDEDFTAADQCCTCGGGAIADAAAPAL